MGSRTEPAVPLLLRHAAPQALTAIDYRYDDDRHVNIGADGSPVASSEGVVLLKTQQVQEGEDHQALSRR